MFLIWDNVATAMEFLSKISKGLGPGYENKNDLVRESHRNIEQWNMNYYKVPIKQSNEISVNKYVMSILLFS